MTRQKSRLSWKTGPTFQTSSSSIVPSNRTSATIELTPKQLEFIKHRSVKLVELFDFLFDLYMYRLYYLPDTPDFQNSTKGIGLSFMPPEQWIEIGYRLFGDDKQTIEEWLHDHNKFWTKEFIADTVDKHKEELRRKNESYIDDQD